MVTDGAAVTVNFSLISYQAWSDSHDFGISENIENAKYLSLNNIGEEANDLSTRHNDIVRVTSYGVEGRELHVIEVSDAVHDGAAHKMHVVLIGRLRGAEPVGTEMTMRFLRHLVRGYELHDGRVMSILKLTYFYILPLVNMESTSKAQTGDCSGSLYTGYDFDNQFQSNDSVS